MDTTQADPESGSLLVGDLAVIALKALLENGIGWIVSSWLDRPTPIDAAIDDARDSVLARQGVLLRRLRSASAVDALVAAPAAAGDGMPLRGAVIFSGERGLRPTLERFVRLESPAPVIGFCFDEEAARIEGAIVIDPAPTAPALVDAIDRAFLASRATGSPVLVLVRERMLGMRGTIRTRANLLPRAGRELDIDVPTGLSAGDAAARLGIVEARTGGGRSTEDVVVVPAALRTVALRAGLASTTSSPASIIVLGAPGITPDVGEAAEVLRAAVRVLVIEDPGTRIRSCIEAATRPGTPVDRAQVSLRDVTGEDVEQLIAAWRDGSAGDAAGAKHSSLVARIPARGEQLHRAVSPVLAAGLALAQGVIGVPGRVTPEYPTYRTETGTTITIVPSAVFVAHGGASAAPGTTAGVFLVTGGAAPGVLEAAAAIGASVEHVDGTSARAIGRAVAAACRTPRPAPHVIIEMPVTRAGGDASRAIGVDHDLLGSERIAMAPVDRAATVLAELEDALTAGPTTLVPDSPAARAALPLVRELSPAMHDVRIVRRAGESRWSDGMWMLRRRLLRAASGVDL